MKWELYIPSREQRGQTARITVDADNWLAALGVGLRGLEEPDTETRKGFACHIDDEGTVHLKDFVSKREFVLRELDHHPPPELVPEDGDYVVPGRASMLPGEPLRTSFPPQPPAAAPKTAARAVSAPTRPPVMIPPPVVAPALPAPPAAAVPASVPAQRPVAIPPPVVAPAPPAPPAPEPVEEPAFALPPHEVFFGRDENPEGGGALWYRERLIAVHPGTGRDEVNLLLMAYYNALHVEAAARPEAKYVNIAVFDHAFASRAERPALGALTWKSWRSEIPEVSYPVDQPAPPGVVAAPPVPPRAEPRPAAAPAQPVQPAPKVVLAPAPAPTPEPKVVLAPAPAPTPEPKVVLAPAPAPTPEPKVVLAPAPAPQPEPRVVLAPAPAPTPEPRVVLAPAPVPTPEPRAVLAPAPPAAAPRAVAHEAPRPSAVPPTTAEVTLPPTGQTGRFRVPTPSPADLARVGRPGEDDIADILAELFDEMDGLFHCRTREASAEFALDVTMRRIPCEAGSVLLADLNAGDLIFTAVRGDSGHRLKGRRVPKGKGIVGYAARHGVAIAIADVHKDTRFTEEIDHETGFATKSVIVAPLVHDNLTYGAVELLNRKGSEMFLQAEVSIISYIASQLAEYLGTSLLASEGDYGDFRIAAPEAQGAPAPVPARPAAAAAAAPVPAPAAAQAAKAAPEVKTKTGRHPTTRAAAASRKGKKGKKGK